MVLPEERKAALLAYCRIDDLTPEEEPLLEMCYGYAIGFLTQAGVSAPAEGTTRRAQYDLCVNALVLDSWDRRGSSSGERDAGENRSFRLLLNQLKMTEPVSIVPDVSELDTSGESG